MSLARSKFGSEQQSFVAAVPSIRAHSIEIVLSLLIAERGGGCTPTREISDTWSTLGIHCFWPAVSPRKEPVSPAVSSLNYMIN